jgi:hypothetical protein
MGSASAWPAEEHWDRGAWLGFVVADESRQPQSVSLWLRATYAERRHGQARDEGKMK